MREADLERYHLLQLRHPVAIADQVRGEPWAKGPRQDQEGVAGGVAPHPSERPLCLSERRTGHRPRCDRGGAEFGLTEFSGVWAYTPIFEIACPGWGRSRLSPPGSIE